MPPALHRVSRLRRREEPAKSVGSRRDRPRTARRSVCGVGYMPTAGRIACTLPSAMGLSGPKSDGASGLYRFFIENRGDP